MQTFRFQAEGLLHPDTQAHYHYITQIDSVTAQHDHDFSEVFLLGFGRVLHHINGQQQPLEEGALVLIRPSDTHCFQPVDHVPCGLLNLAFSTRVLRQMLACIWDTADECPLLSIPQPPLRQLSPAQTKAWINRMERINLFPVQDTGALRRYIRRLLMEMLSTLFAAEPSPAKTHVPPWLASIYAQMRLPENFQQGTPALLRLCDKSAAHLYREFRRCYGQTPSEYIHELRMNYAANLLIHTDRAIPAIATSAGYAHPSYFYEQFRRRFGFTPSQFRREGKISAIGIRSKPDD